MVMLPDRNTSPSILFLNENTKFIQAEDIYLIRLILSSECDLRDAGQVDSGVDGVISSQEHKGRSCSEVCFCLLIVLV